MHQYNWTLFFVLPLLLWVPDWNTSLKQPQLLVGEAGKMFDCEEGKGYVYETGNLISPLGEQPITALVFLQSYGEKWEKKSYEGVGNAALALGLESCQYTGNYYTFAYYSAARPSFVPDVADVLTRHHQRGQDPLFKVTKYRKNASCGGVYFDEGRVFTPNGEQVKITLFMEKQDGHWRKKDFLFVGTGDILLDVDGCDLTGEHKSTVVVNKHWY